MTDYKEEQAMEVEALESIYMDEFTKLADDPLAYQLHIVPNQDGQNNHVAMTLKVVMPPTYPDEAPELDIVLNKGLSDTQRKEMRQLLEEQIQENLGMAMMYTLCEALREYLVENNREGNDGSEHHEMLRRLEMKKKKEQQQEASTLQQTQADSEQKRTFHGTPVTIDSFAAWKAKFEEEMCSKEKTTVKDESTAKLTGRQLWNRGLVSEGTGDAGDEDDDENDEDYVDGEGDDDDDDDDEDEKA